MSKSKRKKAKRYNAVTAPPSHTPPRPLTDLERFEAELLEDAHHLVSSIVAALHIEHLTSDGTVEVPFKALEDLAAHSLKKFYCLGRKVGRVDIRDKSESVSKIHASMPDLKHLLEELPDEDPEGAQ